MNKCVFDCISGPCILYFACSPRKWVITTTCTFAWYYHDATHYHECQPFTTMILKSISPRPNQSCQLVCGVSFFSKMVPNLPIWPTCTTLVVSCARLLRRLCSGGGGWWCSVQPLPITYARSLLKFYTWATAYLSSTLTIYLVLSVQHSNIAVCHQSTFNMGQSHFLIYI